MLDAAEMAVHREKMQTWRARRMEARATARTAPGEDASAPEDATRAERRQRWAKRAAERAAGQTTGQTDQGERGKRGGSMARLDTRAISDPIGSDRLL